MTKENDTSKLEIWKPIPGLEGRYSASNLGRIRFEPRIVKGSPDSCGYLRIRPYPRPDRRVETIHRLVAKTFIGECPEGYEVNHIDGNPQNNAIENLEYVTHKENIRDSFSREQSIGESRHRGEKNNKAKLTEKQVKEIRALKKSGIDVKQIAEQYGIGKTAIYDICAYRTWQHV